MANKKADELRREIAKLPSGYISKKTISGKEYLYYQYSESGKKKSRYLPPEEAEIMAAQMEKKKLLKAQLKALTKGEHPDIDQSYILMHKNTAVCRVIVDRQTGRILSVLKSFAPEHIPLGVSVRNGNPDPGELNVWWIKRSIPASRSGVDRLLNELDLISPQGLLIKSFGLSLSDHYWLKPESATVSWADINFFDNPFSEDIGAILFEEKIDSLEPDFHSPDITSDGFLKKRWKIIHDKRYLIKGGTPPAFQQPFNEAIASLLCSRLQIPCVEYRVIWHDELPYSICEDFADQEKELIPAASIFQTLKQGNNESRYEHLLNCCSALGIENARSSLEKMLVLDYIIANEDRHFNNFGFLRNSETLEFEGFAPIYDSGSSLGFDKLTKQIAAGSNIDCKPFARTHQEQLALVTDFSWIDFNVLSDLFAKIREILLSAGPYADEQRVEAIVSSVERRIEEVKLKAIAESY